MCVCVCVYVCCIIDWSKSSLRKIAAIAYRKAGVVDSLNQIILLKSESEFMEIESSNTSEV
jgi:hypothetical protein